MTIRPAETRATLQPTDGLDRLLAAGIPLHQIEQALDDAELEAACCVPMQTISMSLISRLLWS